MDNNQVNWKYFHHKWKHRSITCDRYILIPRV